MLGDLSVSQSPFSPSSWNRLVDEVVDGPLGRAMTTLRRFRRNMPCCPESRIYRATRLRPQRMPRPSLRAACTRRHARSCHMTRCGGASISARNAASATCTGGRCYAVTSFVAVRAGRRAAPGRPRRRSITSAASSVDQPEPPGGSTCSSAYHAAARFRISFSISSVRLARRSRTSSARSSSSGPRADPRRSLPAARYRCNGNDAIPSSAAIRLTIFASQPGQESTAR